MSDTVYPVSYVNNVVGSIPSGTVIQYAQLPLPITASGIIDFSISHWQYAPNYCVEGKGNLRWKQG